MKLVLTKLIPTLVVVSLIGAHAWATGIIAPSASTVFQGLFEDGTVFNPSISFSDDPSLGVYHIPQASLATETRVLHPQGLLNLATPRPGNVFGTVQQPKSTVQWTCMMDDLSGDCLSVWQNRDTFNDQLYPMFRLTRDGTVQVRDFLLVGPWDGRCLVVSTQTPACWPVSTPGKLCGILCVFTDTPGATVASVEIYGLDSSRYGGAKDQLLRAYGGVTTNMSTGDFTTKTTAFELSDNGDVWNGSRTFANLGTPHLGNGTKAFCSDCDPTATLLACTHLGRQTGAFAFYVNGAWKCMG